MKLKKLDALLVPRADMYSGEEVPEDEERLKYITNFSGSAGYAIISANSDVKSVLFSDGRYELQLKKEVDPKIGDSVGKIKAEADSTKLRSFLANLGADEE